MKYTALIKKMENGWYFAQCEQLPGAMTQGRTIEEAKANLVDAIHLLLEDESEDVLDRHKEEKDVMQREIVLA